MTGVQTCALPISAAIKAEIKQKSADIDNLKSDLQSKLDEADANSKACEIRHAELAKAIADTSAEKDSHSALKADVLDKVRAFTEELLK